MCRDFDRRDFLTATGCFALSDRDTLLALNQTSQEKQSRDQPVVLPVSQHYRFEIEVVSPRSSLCHSHKVGQKYSYPQDLGQICPWLRDSMSGILRAMEWGATFPWDYDGTPYRKTNDPNGVTIEFVRCPDPTAKGIVVKITRTAVKG